MLGSQTAVTEKFPLKLFSDSIFSSSIHQSATVLSPKEYSYLKNLNSRVVDYQNPSDSPQQRLNW